MKPAPNSRSLLIRRTAAAFLSAGAFLLMGACQSYEDSPEAIAEEDAALLGTTDGVADTDAADVDVGEEALSAASGYLCEVRCRNCSLHRAVMPGETACRSYGRSSCGGGKSLRIKFAGGYVLWNQGCGL